MVGSWHHVALAVDRQPPWQSQCLQQLALASNMSKRMVAPFDPSTVCALIACALCTVAIKLLDVRSGFVKSWFPPAPRGYHTAPCPDYLCDIRIAHTRPYVLSHMLTVLASTGCPSNSTAQWFVISTLLSLLPSNGSPWISRNLQDNIRDPLPVPLLPYATPLLRLP
ncbi:hypothetical protein JAAARDRAFT_626656 [Jaapia argillacea MUCL 33604]|uniref:Uncharacterized protein n=1 Tax=Jaapia argillacea MUCL 33604 TaxID=933084 RepID=A0A067PY25_9AGAM|nr:hypothetical protein JAAARDRAFT_626656 [Jaapia argillacea MUCL 33604]